MAALGVQDDGVHLHLVVGGVGVHLGPDGREARPASPLHPVVAVDQIEVGADHDRENRVLPVGRRVLIESSVLLLVVPAEELGRTRPVQDGGDGCFCSLNKCHWSYLPQSAVLLLLDLPCRSG